MKPLIRERLIRTAAEHFARRGFDRARVDEISTDAGFAKGTVYNYFPSKADLFGAVVEQGARLAVNRFAEADRGGTVTDRLTALAQADVSVLREEESFTRVLVREAMAVRPQTHPIISAHLAPFVMKIADVLRCGVEANEIRHDQSCERLAMLFVGMLSLMYVQHWASDGVWPQLDDIPNLVVSMFLDGARMRENSKAVS